QPGDSLVFDVQGVPITATVGSIRSVNWRRVQPNFFIVFPRGVLEEAPQFYVIVTRTPTPEISAAAQQAVVQAYPNISAVDLALILRTVDTILDKVAFVIQFMAFFSIVTGVFVLIGSLLTSRFQRVEESVLLRTLGAVRKQVVQIMSVEYALLGGLASLSGILLAVGATWVLAGWVFESPFDPSPIALMLVMGSVILLTLGIGLLITRDVADKPPLEILRTET
ncbi:MAG: FtsX-like permease family protein, partial [Bacteroidetes bacterium]|nr:FtsX-like permease family protein [Bacteroidota bacterium]